MQIRLKKQFLHGMDTLKSERLSKLYSDIYHCVI